MLGGHEQSASSAGINTPRHVTHEGGLRPQRWVLSLGPGPALELSTGSTGTNVHTGWMGMRTSATSKEEKNPPPSKQREPQLLPYGSFRDVRKSRFNERQKAGGSQWERWLLFGAEAKKSRQRKRRFAF